jgi:hypothetical protein
MNKEETLQNQELQQDTKELKDQGKWQSSPKAARISFIIGIAVLIFTIILIPSVDSIIFEVLFNASVIALYVIYSLTLVISIIGSFFAVLSFKEGKNVFGMLGFTFCFIIIIAMLWAIFMASSIAS